LLDRDKDKKVKMGGAEARFGWSSLGTCLTHDFHPRFPCLSRLLKYLGGHLKSLKLFRTQHNVALKRLASADTFGVPGQF
jgi:hypothetical protein